MDTSIKKIEQSEQKSFPEDFLLSLEWKKFQEAAGRETWRIEKESLLANIITHKLPIVGKYFYCPHGPEIKVKSQKSKVKSCINEIIDLAKKQNIGWIRIEPKNQELLSGISESISEKIVKAPHDMQPKEIFVLDITENFEKLLMQMKPKTRYNIGLATKKGVEIVINQNSKVNEKDNESLEAFLRLTKEMAQRQGIATHPDEYYRKMVEIFPGDMLKIYTARYQGKIIAANLVLFYGKTATYLHGASSNLHRSVMAPFLLQWQAILDAKEKGCENYDFGGVKTTSQENNTWAGITNFKLGFSRIAKPIVFPGSYDIIVNPRKYAVYRGLQKAKSFAVKFRK